MVGGKRDFGCKIFLLFLIISEHILSWKSKFVLSLVYRKRTFHRCAHVDSTIRNMTKNIQV